jgi:hypothetical protein
MCWLLAVGAVVALLVEVAVLVVWCFSRTKFLLVITQFRSVLEGLEKTITRVQVICLPDKMVEIHRSNRLLLLVVAVVVVGTRTPMVLIRVKMVALGVVVHTETIFLETHRVGLRFSHLNPTLRFLGAVVVMEEMILAVVTQTMPVVVVAVLLNREVMVLVGSVVGRAEMV